MTSHSRKLNKTKTDVPTQHIKLLSHGLKNMIFYIKGQKKFYKLKRAESFTYLHTCIVHYSISSEMAGHVYTTIIYIYIYIYIYIHTHTTHTHIIYVCMYVYTHTHIYIISAYTVSFMTLTSSQKHSL